MLNVDKNNNKKYKNDVAVENKIVLFFNLQSVGI